MANQSLRELAKEHAQGNLDREAYKKSRADLLEGILSSKIPLEEIDYPPLVQPPEPEALDDTQRKEEYKKPPAKSAEPEATTAPKPSETKPTTGVAENKGSNKLLLGALGLAILAILVVAVLMLSNKGKDSRDAATNSVTSAAAETEKVSVKTAKSDKLIKEFLARKNWSAGSLDTLREQWLTLTEEETPSSEDNIALGQLTNAIYKQLLEEQALSGLVDDDSSLNKQEQLIEFAAALGISDDRLKLTDGR